MDKNLLAQKFSTLRGDAFSPAREEIEELLLNHLTQLSEKGEYSLDPLVSILSELTDFKFIVDKQFNLPDSIKLVSSSEDDIITVIASLSEFHVGVDITCELPNVMETGEVKLDPRHIAFYAQWEKLNHVYDSSKLDKLSESEKTVYYIGMLEAQVMNGGIGQYLANTEGEYVDATIECLQSIGAEKTCQILNDAVALKQPSQSFDDVWDEYADQLDQLDQTFMESEEDLAALTADKFL